METIPTLSRGLDSTTAIAALMPASPPPTTRTAGDNLCMIASETFHKGNSFTRVMTNIADNTLEGVLWSLSGGWKIFQVRLYELP